MTDLIEKKIGVVSFSFNITVIANPLCYHLVGLFMIVEKFVHNVFHMHILPTLNSEINAVMTSFAVPGDENCHPMTARVR